jgi:hypothetical protein
MAFCPLITIPLCNSQPSVRRSFVQIAGRTKLSVGMCETREYRKIAASSDWKKMRAPAKKKFPMLQHEQPYECPPTKEAGCTLALCNRFKSR